jgi:transcriptional regulator with XRE-family HTH domain
MRPIEKIDMLLKDSGVSARTLAKAINIPEDRIYKWRKAGQGQPTAQELVDIALYFRVPAEFLLNPELTEIPEPSLTAAQLVGIKMISSLELSEGEVIRRLSGQLPTLAPTTPVAEHRGRDGGIRASGIDAKRQDTGIR